MPQCMQVSTFVTTLVDLMGPRRAKMLVCVFIMIAMWLVGGH